MGRGLFQYCERFQHTFWPPVKLGNLISKEWFWLLGLFMSSTYCKDVNIKAFEPTISVIKGVHLSNIFKTGLAWL